MGADGSTTVHGRSVGLSSPADRARFHQLRKSADCILIGGNTARTEPYSLTPVPLTVLTHGDLPDEVKSNPRATAKSSSIDEALSEMSGTILIEAGPAILKEALSKKLVDEFYLTITPAQVNENAVNIESLTENYVEVSREDVGGDIFLKFIPKR